MKKIVRKQSSGRKASTLTKTIKKSKIRGGTASKLSGDAKDFYMVKKHDNNQCRSVLAKMSAREVRRLSLRATGAHLRQREQLCAIGKQRKHTVKTEFNVPERWTEHVPPNLQVLFTVEDLLKAMVQGKIKPMYDMEGKNQAAAMQIA